jgi:hypothetical protein
MALSKTSPNGLQYPLYFPSDDIEELLVDAYLNYVDDAKTFEAPFSIKWLYGFGSDPAVSTPPAVSLAYEIEVVDANNETVFSSLTSGTAVTTRLWHNDLRIVNWTQVDTGQFFNVVFRDGLSGVPIYFEPTSAQLHARTIMQDPPRVRSITVGLNTYTTEDLQIKNGFNTLFEIGETEKSKGTRRKTSIQIDANPGAGAGKFGPPCSDNEVYISSINDVEPDSSGRIYLDAGGCYRIERPVISELNPDPAREVQLRDNALQLSNDCGPCCSCDDFIAVWEAIRKLRNRYAAAVADAKSARDQYHANRTRFLENQECRLNDKLRLVMQPSCPGQLGVAVGYCNNSDECVEGLVIHVSFDYQDINGNEDPSGGVLSATTTAPFSSVVCDSTFRGGFVDPTLPGNKRYVRNAFYTLGGSWPHFWAYFPLVDPGGQAYTTFRLQFDDPTSAEFVEAVADAFEVGSQAAIGGNSPVPGYQLGGGCNDVVCMTTMHLIDSPVKESSQLIAECCESTSIL